MICISEKKDCCGCGACKEACPKNCITLEVDKEGFWYPKVDKSECIECGKCERVCPVILARKEPKTQEKDALPETYVAYYDNPLRLESSSGGIFTVIAEHILGENGIVFGAAFDDHLQVHHIGIESVEELKKLRGSKYSQSRLENTYTEAKAALDSGRRVLYSGTACQIAGLKGFLGKEYDNLLTVDVLCHGVPSPLVWEKYLEEESHRNHAEVKSVSFRQKHTGWKNYSVALQLADGNSVSRVFRRDPFMQLFLKNTCLRPSCHHCEFKDIDRCSDMTIGDAWGVENHMPDMDDDKGTSVVLLHSENGKKVFAKLQPELVYKKAECNVVLPESADSRKSVSAHPKREKILSKLQQGKSVSSQARIIRPRIWERVYYKLRRIIFKR